MTTATDFDNDNIDANGLIEWTPIEGGNFQIAIKATDQYGASTTVVYPVRVLDNAPPHFEFGFISPAFLGHTFTYSLKVKDPNPGDQIEVTLDTSVNMTKTLTPVSGQPGVWDLTLTWNVPEDFPGPPEVDPFV